MVAHSPYDGSMLHLMITINLGVTMFTKAKSWCTIDTDIGLNEEELLDKCDIVLMFIELGVYGELKSRPYAPPGHVFLQDATTDLLKPGPSTSPGNKLGNGILDLTSTGDLDTNHNITANGQSTNTTSVREQNMDAVTEISQENVVEISPINTPEQHASTTSIMMKCVVNLTRLTDKEINIHSGKETNVIIGGYNMRQRSSVETHFDRSAKYNVKYSSSTDYSSDESYSRCTPPPKRHRIAVISGPTPESLAAHARHQKEKTAADALLELGNVKLIIPLSQC